MLRILNARRQYEGVKALELCSETSSMPAEMVCMQRFVADLLAREGALVEAIERLGLNQATGAMPDTVLDQIAPLLAAYETEPQPPAEDLPAPLGRAARARPDRASSAIAPVAEGRSVAPSHPVTCPLAGHALPEPKRFQSSAICFRKQLRPAGEPRRAQ